MQRSWRAFIQKLMALGGAGSVAATSAAGTALAALPPAAGGDQLSAPPDPKGPLVFTRPYSSSDPERFAGHSSHASHASHSSHYSGSGGGYTPDYTPPPAPPSYTPPSYAPPAAPFVALPATRPAPSATEKLVLVMRVQARLHELGYYAGTVDGVFGETTRSALRNFQLVKGLPATAKLDDGTLLALGITH